MKKLAFLALLLLLAILVSNEGHTSDVAMVKPAQLTKTVTFYIGGEGKHIVSFVPDESKTLVVGEGLNAVLPMSFGPMLPGYYGPVIPKDFIRAEFDIVNAPLIDREPYWEFNYSEPFEEEAGMVFTDNKMYDYSKAFWMWNVYFETADRASDIGFGDNYSRAFGFINVNSSKASYWYGGGTLDPPINDTPAIIYIYKQVGSLIWGRVEGVNFVGDSYVVNTSGVYYLGEITQSNLYLDARFMCPRVIRDIKSLKMRLVFRINWTSIVHAHDPLYTGWDYLANTCGVALYAMYTKTYPLLSYYSPVGSNAFSYYNFEANYTSHGIKLANFYPNGTVKWWLDPSNKHFNVSYIDGWWIIDFDFVSIIDVNRLLSEYGYIPLAKYIGAFFAIIDINTTMVNCFPIIIDGFCLTITCTTIGSLFVNSLYYDVIAPVGASFICKDGDFYMILRDKVTISLYPFVVYRLDTYKYQLTYGIIKNREEIIEAVNKLLNISTFRFVKQIKLYFEYVVSGVSSKTVSSKVGYYEVNYRAHSDLEIALKKLKVPDGVYEAVIYDDGLKSVQSPVGSYIFYESVQKHDLDITVHLFTKVKLTVEVYDVRGRKIQYAAVKLKNKETGREFALTVEGDNATAEVESGEYDITITTLVYTERQSAVISVYSSEQVLRITLSKDIRELSGETLRYLLLYVPIIFIIPLLFIAMALGQYLKKKK